MPTVKPIPEGYHTVTPYLVATGAAKLIDFMKQAFGAQELFRMAAPDGKIGHAEVKIGDSHIMLGEAGGPHPAMPAMITLACWKAASKASSSPGFTDNSACSRTIPR